MAYLDVHFYSRVLGLTTTMGVILPEPDQGIGVTETVWDGVEPLPVLYLLHCMSDDHTIWMRRTSLDRYAAGRKMAIVMPAAGRSFYADQKYGLDYMKFLAEELPEIVKRFFKVSEKREDTFVAGLSMGGYGAMKLALNYPERYGYAASLSGLLDLKAFSETRHYTDIDDDAYMEKLRAADFETYRGARDFKLNFGSLKAFDGSKNDLVFMVNQLGASGKPIPKLNLSIGMQDYLYPTNVTFRKALDEQGIEYSYTEFPGVHEWGVWDRVIVDVLDWLPVEKQRPTGNGGDEKAKILKEKAEG